MLARACASVLAQTHKKFTWAIVNDGGAQAPVDEIAAQAAVAGVKVMVHHLPASNGMEAASNHAISADNTASFIAIHDDDDTWHPEFLAEMVPALNAAPEHAAMLCHVELVQERISGNHIHILKRVSYPNIQHPPMLHEVAQQNRFPPIALLFRKEACQKLGGFDARMQVLGDWDFALKLLLDDSIGLLPKTLAYYHQRPRKRGIYGNSVIAQRAAHKTARKRYITEKIAAAAKAPHSIEGRIGQAFLDVNALAYTHFWPRLKRMLRRIKAG